MMRFTSLITIFLIFTASLFAQAPEKFTYQAVVRNANNSLVINAQVGVRVNILQGSTSGVAVYSESHVASTNANGLITVSIGGGSVLHGSFAGIDWSDGPYFLKTDIDPNGGNDYTITSTQQLLSVPYALYAKEAGNSFSGDYNDLTNTPTIPTVPTNVSAFTNDAGYLTDYTEQQVLSISNDTLFLTGGSYVKLPAGFDGDYNSLTNKPTIPTVPTNVSAFTNDAGYITGTDIPAIPTVPTNVSAFTNDVGYLTDYTEQQVLSISNDTLFLTGGSYVKLPAGFDGDYNSLTNKPVIPTTVGELTNDANYITIEQVPAQMNADWNATEGVTQIMNKPTNVSVFTNDAGYLTEYTEQQVLSISNDTLFLTGGSFVRLPAGFDGDYNSLTNKPVIPTTVGELTNDANYITIEQVPAQVNADWNATEGAAQILNKPTLFSGDYNDLTNLPQIPQIPADISAFNNDAGYLTSFTEQQVLSISNDTLFLTGGSFVKLPAGFDGDYNDLTNLPQIPQIPADISAFNNDVGYITMNSIPAIPTVPTNVSAFTNDAGYLTGYTETDPQFNAWDKDYNDLTNKPIIPTVPTNVSAFTNDAGYVTANDIPAYQVLSISNDTIYLSNGGYAVLPPGFDGDYNSLTNRPDLFSGSYNDLTDTPTIPAVPSNVSAFTNDAGYLTSFTEQQVLSISNDTLFLTGGSFVKLPATGNSDSTDLSALLARVEQLEIPSVSTLSVAFVSYDYARVTGRLFNSGIYWISDCGFCWSTSQNPTLDDNHNTVTSELGFFSQNLTGLDAGTTYYVRAYATNSAGTAYGEQLSFTTAYGNPDGQPCPGTPTVTDHEGNVYNTVQIGEQCWTKENLRTTTSPSTGTYLIPDVNAGYSFVGKQARWYDNDSTTYAPMNYGLLYNWNAAVDTFHPGYGETSTTGISNLVSFTGRRRGICPAGWHLPSDAEWEQLIDYVHSLSEYVCGNYYSSNIAKVLASTTGWNNSTYTCAVGYNQSLNNATGFSAVPAGGYYGSLSFKDMGVSACFWSSSSPSEAELRENANVRFLNYNKSNVSGEHRSKSIGYSVRCLRDVFEGAFQSQTSLSTVTTSIVSDITGMSATCGGNITSDGGASVTARGVCWGTSQNPTVSGSHTTDGNGTGSFTSSITGLTAGTTYYVRAYATNSSGTAYGDEVSFTTLNAAVIDEKSCPSAPTVTDHDGNVYNTVKIGNQCWMKENLRTTSYSDGTPIEQGTDTSRTTAYWYYPSGNSGNMSTLGLLYNWAAVMRGSASSSENPSGVQGICPTGWHVPSDAEWTELTDYVSSQSEYACSGTSIYIAKALASTTGWNSFSSNCTVGNTPSDNNATGLGIVPAGYYSGNYNAATTAYCSSATEYNENYVCNRNIGFFSSTVNLGNLAKYAALSVRCIKD